MMDVDEPASTQSSEFIDSQMLEEAPVLVFPESLLGTTKPLKVGELTLLLKILHHQLKQLEQNVDTFSLTVVTQELVHKQILKNSNKTIKALAACCLADIVRLHAPTCPYAVDVLKTVFSFFISQLTDFGTESPDFQYHFYLLENLQSVKTFLLLSEIDNADELVLPLAAEFFNASELGSLARNVELCMTDILIQLLEDVGILGAEITELILEEFEKFDKGSKNPAYVMAMDICYACPNILQRRVCQYFSDALLSVSDSGSSEDIEEVKKMHNLIRKINATVPELLLNVLPLLQEEMKLDNLNIRQFATETMGKMFADPSSNVAEKYPAIWKTWLGRRDDKVVQIRVQWLEMCIEIYKNYPTSAPDLIESFKIKLADPDEKVRTTVCKILGEIGMEHDIQKLDKALLESISERTKDKKSPVRMEAMKTIGSIYQSCYHRIRANDKTAIDRVGWIPNHLMNCLYVGDASVLVNLESTLNNYILPQVDNDSERAERLVNVVGTFGEKQKLAFTALVRKQKLFIENMHTYVNMCENAMDNAGLNEHEANKSDEFMKYLAGHLPEAARTLNALRSFLNRENEQDVKLLKNAIDYNRTYKQIQTAKEKLLSSLNDDQSANIEIFQAILNRACPLIINKNIVPHLLKLSRSTKGGRRSTPSQTSLIAQEILKEISITYPTMYATNMKDIIDEIMADNDATAEEGLQLLSEISKASNGEMVYKDAVTERLKSYVTNGNVSQAEYAATALSNMQNADVILADLAANLSLNLLLDASNLLATLTSLSQFALYCPDLITPSIDSMIRFIESDLLNAKTKEFADKNPEWTPYDELPELSQHKITGIRLLVNYLIGCREESVPEGYIIEKIFGILWELLDRTCDGAVADKTNAAETSHLRLGATQALVKLTHYTKYMNELTVTNFERLAISLQDTCFDVRQEFAETLIKCLQTGQIHSRYYTLLFICAHEPDMALLKQIKSFIKKRLSVMEVKQGEPSILESSLVCLIHLLAHHPDFTEAVEDLVVFAQYLRFYISCVATADNVSFLYHLAQKIKLSKDMVTVEMSKNSYILSDLACLLIKSKCKEVSWPLVAYEGRVMLQSKLYRSLPAGAVQTETIKTNYLPNEFIEKFEEEQKHKTGDKRSRSGVFSANKKAKV